MLHPVILSGGSGTRLWPLSRRNHPKQFLALLGDHSLYQETVLRAMRLPGVQAPVTVCSDDHRFMVGEQLQAIGQRNGGILLEPVGRNTAPAIALAAHHVLASDPDGVLLVLPADHLIQEEAAFRDAVQSAVPLAEDGWLATFGITPDAPETGYGYIRTGERLDTHGFRVSQFVEKPDRERAEAYLRSGEAFEKLKDEPSARRTYQELTESEDLSQFQETEQAGKRLKALGGPLPKEEKQG